MTSFDSQIAVNFLQVTSVAVSINVEWTQTVKNMLETESKSTRLWHRNLFGFRYSIWVL